jgi:hypothetical protein
MITYQYQLLRYLHDRVSGEFVNVGVVVFEPTTRFLKAKVVTRFSRISQFFSDISGHYLLQTLRNIEREVNDLSISLSDGLTSDTHLRTLTTQVLPNSDNALIFTEVLQGIDISPKAAFDDLFERIVDRYNRDPGEAARTDAYAWRKVYKRYFDQLGITRHLQSHTVTTRQDTLQFDKAWKNGVWHCYQSVSFDLQKEDAIRNKVYKWSGILDELKTSDEEVKLYLLTVSPRDDKDLEDFILSKLDNKQVGKVQVSVVCEQQAERFARQVKQEMEDSMETSQR